MKFKPGVKVQGVRPELLFAIMIADDIWHQLGQTLVITSLLDSKHSPTSLHYTGCAVDFRIWDLDVEKAVAMLREALPGDYQVVIEKDHIHLEYQPRYEH